MSGSFKTEAIVLRSIRYGEADRVLHLYTLARGRVGAVGLTQAEGAQNDRLALVSPSGHGPASLVPAVEEPLRAFRR